MFRFLYFSIYLMALSFGALVSSKIRRMWKQRIGREIYSKYSKPTLTRPIWIHASSGEFEYAKPVLKRLKDQNRTTLVSFFSPTYSIQVLKNPYVDFAEPLPFDIEGPVRAFLDRYNPQELWVARTDLWPEVLRQCKKRSIPVILFSASRPPPSSFNKYIKYFSLRLWNQLTKIYCVSNEDKINLQAWGVEVPIEVLGDTRYDQVEARLNQSQSLELLEAWRPNHPGIPLLTAGSTWKEDEEVLIKACQKALINDQLRMVIAPHEPTETHLKALETKFKTAGLISQRWSHKTSWDSHILIIDQVGILAEAYQYGDLAFVGGSFKVKVHSVMEPLAAGCPTLIGPLHKNNREALDFQIIPAFKETSELMAVTSCADAMAFSEALLKFIDANQFEAMKANIKHEIRSRTGSSERLIQLQLS